MKLFFGMLALVVLGTGIYGLFFAPTTYEGKELLSPTQYEDFKIALADEDVSIRSINVISSNPILVDFRVAVSGDTLFIYGEHNDICRFIGAGAATAGGAFFCVILVASFMKQRIKEAR